MSIGTAPVAPLTILIGKIPTLHTATAFKRKELPQLYLQIGDAFEELLEAQKAQDFQPPVI